MFLIWRNTCGSILGAKTSFEAYDESFLLKEWSKMDTKYVMRNFSSKDTSMKVPLLKSAIHHDVASSKSSHSDGSFNN
ncbi:hypothetical protein H5410_036280 [Solanum commersonii]|uniref:Uncharacterized protein n=1 Tax=Solanum commersonii TaxID=4109 RepID=A0A9J5Y614_SOLCO|nr:hypothetical protein H5410_036280 [Solanum commersonii]